MSPLNSSISAGAFAAELVPLRAVVHDGCGPLECLGAEAMLRVEVRDREVELAIASQPFGVLHDVGPVARSQARIDHQRGLRTDNDADVRHEIYAPIWNHKDAVGELNGVTLHNWRWRSGCLR